MGHNVRISEVKFPTVQSITTVDAKTNVLSYAISYAGIVLVDFSVGDSSHTQDFFTFLPFGENNRVLNHALWRSRTDTSFSFVVMATLNTFDTNPNRAGIEEFDVSMKQVQVNDLLSPQGNPTSKTILVPVLRAQGVAMLGAINRWAYQVTVMGKAFDDEPKPGILTDREKLFSLRTPALTDGGIWELDATETPK